MDRVAINVPSGNNCRDRISHINILIDEFIYNNIVPGQHLTD